MICFVNGYWNRVIGITHLAPAAPGEAYWNHFSSDFLTACREMMESEKNESICFIDGSSQFVLDQPAAIRYQHGYQNTQQLLTDWSKEGLLENSIKIVSHSEGCAFGAGMVDYLKRHRITVEKILYLSPREPLAFVHPDAVFAVQVHYANDAVCPPHPIPGVGVYIQLERFQGRKASLKQAHGATVKRQTLLRVEKILSLISLERTVDQMDTRWEITESASTLLFQRIENHMIEKS